MIPKILINFSNAYIFHSEILPNLQSIKDKSECKIYLVVSNYFYPDILSRDLQSLCDQGVIEEFLILEAFGSFECPKGRPIYKFFGAKRRYEKLTRLIKQNDFDVIFLHTTNEVSDQYLLKHRKRSSTKFVLLQPTYPGLPIAKASIQSRTRRVAQRKFLGYLRNRVVYLVESVYKTFLMFSLTRVFLKPSRWSLELMTEEWFDLALTASKLDAEILAQRIHSLDFQFVNFFSNETLSKESSLDILLVLLPFIDQANAPIISSILKRDLCDRSDFQEFSNLRVRPHPRSDIHAVSTLESLFREMPINSSIDYDSSQSLFSEVSQSKEVILFRSSSTLRLVQRNFPSKRLRILVDTEEIPDESGSISQHFFADKVVGIIHGLRGRDENTSDRAC